MSGKGDGDGQSMSFNDSGGGGGGSFGSVLLAATREEDGRAAGAGIDLRGTSSSKGGGWAGARHAVEGAAAFGGTASFGTPAWKRATSAALPAFGEGGVGADGAHGGAGSLADAAPTRSAGADSGMSPLQHALSALGYGRTRSATAL